jgi:hypothetical protein
MSIDKKGFRFRLNNVLSWAALGGVAITLIVFGYLGKLFVVTGVIGSLWVATIFFKQGNWKGFVFFGICFFVWSLMTYKAFSY